MHVGSNAFDAMDNGSWFVTSRNGVRGDAGSIQVFKRGDGEYRHWWDVPTLESLTRPLTFLKSSPPQLAVACMDFTFTSRVPRASAQFVERRRWVPGIGLLPNGLRSRTDFPVLVSEPSSFDGKNFVTLVTLEMRGHFKTASICYAYRFVIRARRILACFAV
jgi:hypothetical protein